MNEILVKNHEKVPQGFLNLGQSILREVLQVLAIATQVL